MAISERGSFEREGQAADRRVADYQHRLRVEPVGALQPVPVRLNIVDRGRERMLGSEPILGEPDTPARHPAQAGGQGSVASQRAEDVTTSVQV